MRTAILIACLCTCRPDLTGPASARQLSYAQQAFDLGRTSDSALYDAFTRGYELAPGGTIGRAEIVTEFRRAVMIVRDHTSRAENTFTEHDLAKAMAPFAGTVTIIVEVRLHPLNTFTSAPRYDLYVETGRTTRPLAADPFTRDPVFPFATMGPRSPIVGVRLEGTFRRADIESASAPALVVTDDKANVIWKARLDLARYR
jgi:hypothetical protein